MIKPLGIFYCNLKAVDNLYLTIIETLLTFFNLVFIEKSSFKVNRLVLLSVSLLSNRFPLQWKNVLFSLIIIQIKYLSYSISISYSLFLSSFCYLIFASHSPLFSLTVYNLYFSHSLSFLSYTLSFSP